MPICISKTVEASPSLMSAAPAYASACDLSVEVEEKPYSMPPRTPIELATKNVLGNLASLMPRQTLPALVSLDNLRTHDCQSGGATRRASTQWSDEHIDARRAGLATTNTGSVRSDVWHVR